ncbi:MAG: GAF domain-containing protein [Proteobacteria bacterium]|nr:GAF domain-containing protein [Pseudomonadota bacterium]
MSNQRLYKTIYTIASVINSSLNPKKVLSSIAEQVTGAMDAKGCFIRLLDATGEILLPDASYGLSKRYAQKGPVNVAKSLLDQDVLRGEAVFIPDVRTDKRFQYGAEAAEEGLVSLVVVPLTARGAKVIGVLRVYSGKPREFDAEEKEFLACIANLSGIALENARMFHALKRASELAEAYNYQTFED